MKTQCLSFNQIPHTTRLFADYLAWAPSVQQFYSRPPHFREWIKDETGNVRYDDARRERVADVLKRQNQAWGASEKTLENIQRLRKGAFVAVTGQQIGVFGGPAFSLYKALTAIKLAADATATGVDCVPVFWLATEDHDLEEVSQVGFPGADWAPQAVAVPSRRVEDAPVGTAVLEASIQEVMASVTTLLGESDMTRLLAECYCEGATLGTAFARLFTKLLGEWGVILLDASEPELHSIAESIYRAAIERAEELDEALLERGRALEHAGYHQQVKVTASSTLLFTLRSGARVPIHRQAGTGTGNAEFLIGEERVSRPELLSRISTSPEQYSANVLLRPVLQDYLLPTLVYSGGAAEAAYFAQAAVVYQTLLGRVTPIIPRFSATLIEPKAQGLLERHGLNLLNVIQGPEALLQRISAQALPQELQAAFDRTTADLDGSLGEIRGLLERLDRTLVDAAMNAGAKMKHQLEGLRSRAARAEARHSEVLERHARSLSNALYPSKALQEREVAGIYFLARYGVDFLRQLHDVVNTDCLNHCVVSI